ncbi:DoxX family membrane protein OS=Streptomyces tendae OX=1932 GN=GUR47_04155 PE=4 SV=1 [Streptomyces tendae]
MRLPVELRHVAPRLATGAFILNSGLAKRGADEQAATMMHGMAKNTYPFLADCGHDIRPAAVSR